ncbi:Interleukin-1 receptor-like 1 [Frankliniella fusca]|uniref:Interleukin-1 receptor-like 1 n=1 Tax=Frankliniella fusca TaxID=407009 RepID=A0AAE1LMA0_9NEOP|nr:Interleukin-1 receptor-like 1 [Frankliniella fusca]
MWQYIQSSPLLSSPLLSSPDGCIDTFFSQLQSCMERLADRKKYIIICGDLNIDVLCKNGKQIKLQCFMEEHGLNSITNMATRVSYNCNSGIDHIITNIPLENLTSSCNIEVGMSDHLLQQILVNYKTLNQNSSHMFEYKRMYTARNECMFIQELSNEEWPEVYAANSTNEKFTTFHQRFTELYNKCFPVRKLNTINNNKKDWVTKGIKVTSSNFRNLCKQVKTNNDPKLKDHYTKYRKIYRKVIDSAKRLSIKSEILNAKNITKTTWKVINRNMVRNAVVMMILLI